MVRGAGRCGVSGLPHTQVAILVAATETAMMERPEGSDPRPSAIASDAVAVAIENGLAVERGTPLYWRAFGVAESLVIFARAVQA